MPGETQIASLEMAMDPPANAGACTGNLSCVYTHTLSWRSPTQPLPMEWNPRAVFEKLFGDTGSTDRAAREARLRQHKSLLDSVNEKLASLGTELGPQDRVKVEQYTEAVRDVERRIERAEQQADLELPDMDQPQGAPPVFEDHLALMLDLQLLAYQSDLTRVISFMLGKEQSAPPVSADRRARGASSAVAPPDDQAELIAHMSKINRYHTELFSKYLAKLRATPDGDGSLLDHMTILYGSGISNSTRHSGENLPLLVVGGGSGKAEGRPPCEIHGQTVDGQSADDADGQDGRAGRAHWRKHGQGATRCALALTGAMGAIGGTGALAAVSCALLAAPACARGAVR